MLRSPPIHWSSRSPRCTRCGPIFIGDLRSRTSLSCEHATWRGRGYMLARFLVGLRGSTSSGPSRPCSMAGARRRQLRGARSSSSSTSSPAPSQSAWLLQRPSPVASSTSSKVATVGAAAAASGPNTPACSAVDARRSVALRECMSMSILMSHRPISTSTVMAHATAGAVG